MKTENKVRSVSINLPEWIVEKVDDLAKEECRTRGAQIAVMLRERLASRAAA